MYKNILGLREKNTSRPTHLWGLRSLNYKATYYTILLHDYRFCYLAYGNSISTENPEYIQGLQNSAIKFNSNWRRYDPLSYNTTTARYLWMQFAALKLKCLANVWLTARQHYIYLDMPCRQGPFPQWTAFRATSGGLSEKLGGASLH